MNSSTETANSSLKFAALSQKIRLRQAAQEMKHYGAVWKVAITLIALVLLAGALIPIVMVAIGQIDGGGLFFGLVLIAGAIYGFSDAFREVRKNIRIRNFAAANGLGFASDKIDDSYPGTYFQARYVRIADMIRFPGNLFFELGNFRIVGQQERSYSGPTYGYLRIKLPRRLPHMMLQAKASGSPLPGSLDPSQILRLEGDWDRVFTLYAPKDYETDALYVFTPDVMQKFMDLMGNFNCEIVDDEIYFFGAGRFDLTKPQVIMDLLDLIHDTMQKFDHQIAYYSDAQVDNRQLNTIATPGRQLKNSLWLQLLWLSFGVILFGLLVYGAYYFIGQAKAHPDISVYRLSASSCLTIAIAFVIGTAVRWWQRPRS